MQFAAIRDGTNVATGPSVEPHESNEQMSLDWTPDEKPTQALVPHVEPPAAPRPTAEGRSPMLMVAVIGAVVGGLATVAFVGVGRTPIEPATAPVAASAPPPPPPAAVESIPPPTWSGSRRAGWASDGSRTIDFHLSATRDVSVWMNKARPALVVRCLSRTIEAFVILDTSASFEQDADRRTVRVQWDNDPATVQQWAVSETGRELFAPDAKALMARMETANRLQFGFTPFNAEPVTAEFVVAGFDQLSGLVTGTCK